MSNLRDFNLSELRTRFGLHAFIETGCLVGDGIAAAIDAGFDAVYSCDIAPAHLEATQKRFEGDGRVHLVLCESLSFLRGLDRQQTGSALFWLDAHFPGSYGLGALEPTIGKFPVLNELAIIRERGAFIGDVILIDDIRVIEDDANSRWTPGEIPEYYVVRGLKLADLVDPFTSSHDAVVLPHQEGVLQLTPQHPALVG